MILTPTIWFWTPCFRQSEQKAKKGEDVDEDEEKMGEEDSHFMKLAKKLTAKTLQKKGQHSLCWATLML